MRKVALIGAFVGAALAALGGADILRVGKAFAQNVACYLDQGGAAMHAGSGCTWQVESGGILNVASGGALKIAGTQVNATAAELNAANGVTPGTVAASKAVVVDANKHIDTIGLPVSGLKIGVSGSEVAVSATAAELNVNAGVTAGTVAASKTVVADANKNVAGLGIFSTMVGAGGTKTLQASDNNKVVALDTTSGSVVTLPAATGSGARYRFYVSVLATSNSHIVYTASGNGAGGNDVFVGIVSGTRVDSGNAVLGFAAASTSNTITLNRTTTGSVSKGEWIEVSDVATNVWQVSGVLSATGAAFATPFSHT